MVSRKEKIAKKHHIVKELLQACRSGSLAKLLKLLRENIIVYADDHQLPTAKLRQLVGIGQCSRFLEDAVNREHQDSLPKLDYLNDRPAAFFYRPDQNTPSAIMFIEEQNGQISKIFFLKHPEHLTRQVANL